MKKRLALVTVVGAAAIALAVTTSKADPNLTNVPPHRHFVKGPNGQLSEIGPRVCDNPDLQKAFDQFHNNIHIVTAAGIGPAAPGLHNFKGADMMASKC